MNEESEPRRAIYSLLRSSIFAGIFIGLIVVLGTASNKMLDIANVVNKPGLTIDQRKEKARRNQIRWDRIEGEQ